jgi:hypothetical protein
MSSGDQLLSKYLAGLAGSQVFRLGGTDSYAD